jgi:hypothetical protein
VKAEHRHPSGLLKPHSISESKWELILIDFIIGLPLMARRHNSIFMVVDTLTKSAHFILVRMTYQAPNIPRIFVSKIVRLSGMPKRIISNREVVFIGRFWTSSQEAFGTQLNFSTTYHPETDGRTEGTKQILEDMLHIYLLDQKKHWVEFLPLVELCTTTTIKVSLRWHF